MDYMLTRYSRTLSELTVFKERMLRNIWLTNGLVFSGRVLTKLITKGLSRETAYDIVQKAAFECSNKELDFRKILKQCPTNQYLTDKEIDDCFEVDYYLRNVDKIYRRVFENYE